jgi:general stress protein 26
MDSINAQQTEHNRADLSGQDAIQKLKELAEDKTCFFCTASSGGGSQGVRPMSALQVDEQGNVWFLSASDSRKNAEITANAAVKLLFQGSKHAEFLTLDGVAAISRDKAKLKELWGFLMKTWFTEGEDDSRITVIKVTPIGGYYWDNKHGSAVAGIKMVIGATIGKTLDDSVEGVLAPTA